LSQASVTSKPYFYLISLLGTLLKVHMPSSANASVRPEVAKRAIKPAVSSFLDFMMEILDQIFRRRLK
jgi:hypothetical protein